MAIGSTLPTVSIIVVGITKEQSGMRTASATPWKDRKISPAIKLRKLMPINRTEKEVTPRAGCCIGKISRTTGAVAE